MQSSISLGLKLYFGISHFFVSSFLGTKYGSSSVVVGSVLVDGEAPGVSVGTVMFVWLCSCSIWCSCCFVSVYCFFICICSWLSNSFIALAVFWLSFDCLGYFLCRIIAVVSINFMVSSLKCLSPVSNSLICSLFRCCSLISGSRKSCCMVKI